MNGTEAGREALDELARESDRIVNLILHSSLPHIDIEIMIDSLRRECARLCPGTEELFEMVYASRFRRIWEQWAGERPKPEDEWAAEW